ncbi:MAG: C1 family peptidase [Acidobacteriota bacterium]
MKKINLSLLIFAFLVTALFIPSCAPEEKTEEAVAREVIQIGEETLIQKDSALYKTREFRGRTREYLSVDFSGITKPTSLHEFNQHFHLPPIRQDRTGTCWSFATTSFLESELKRLYDKEIKLSEMYTVYWEYVEKARRFIREKGNSFLGQGSEHNAVILRMKEYGAVPAEAYTDLPPGKTEHNHSELFQEFKNYLDFCKANEYWDENKTLAYVRSILDKHLGKPLEKVEVNGQAMTPQEYLKDVLQLPLDDYVCFMSLKYLPFYTKGEYKVPDNWWHSEDYHNVPLNEFYQAIFNSLEKGFTVALGGDVSEPGIEGGEDIALIPTFDILPQLIDQDSREYRFYNKTSFDDHAIHAVGFTQKDNYTWFLIKDSGSGAHRGQFKGYYFYRDDYIRLKMLSFMVHKDAVQELLAKFE